MNREQARKLAKKHKIPFNQIRDMYNEQAEITHIELENIEGMKVKIKTQQIIDSGNHKEPKFQQFIRDYENFVFTAEKDPDRLNETFFYQLKEDPSLPKWLFHKDDLEIILDEKKIISDMIQKTPDGMIQPHITEFIQLNPEETKIHNPTEVIQNNPVELIHNNPTEVIQNNPTTKIIQNVSENIAKNNLEFNT